MNGSQTVDTDIASRMLLALMNEPESEHELSDIVVSIDEQKRYLNRWIDSLLVDDQKSVGNVLVMNNRRDALRQCSEGTVINLDALPPNIIEQMYNLVLYKIEKRV